MKSFYYIIVLFVVCLLAQDSLAQIQTPRTRRTLESNNNNTGLPELSVRARAKNEAQGVNIDNVVWLRMLYREIDLTKAENAPLYFPTEPVGDRMNLFTMMFKLLMDGKLTAYRYIDDRREVFTDQYKVDLERDLLIPHRIMYQKSGTGETASFVIDDVDIPGNEVLAYYIKEAVYFDQATGTFGSQVIAISPISVWEGDYGYGVTERTPLFWVPYEKLRPYISRSLIMTSNYNNALTYTTDDFFQLKMYEGDIIKTTNMMNYTLAQQFPDSAAYKNAQDSIETQLKDFEKRLWLPKENTAVTTNTEKKDTKADQAKATDGTNRQSVRASRSSSNRKSSAKSSAPKTKTEKAPSSPTRSVRRR